MKKKYDCLVIGGGPAGLTAAIYLARFNRSVLVIDKQDGRSSYAQKNENYFGFPKPIKVRDLCLNGRKQAEKYGSDFCNDEILQIKKVNETFICQSGSTEYHGRTLILAMGVTDLFPHIGKWKKYVGRSLFWCITCDGYKTMGKKIVVIGQTDEAVCTALQFLNYTKDISFVTNILEGKETISPLWRKRLTDANIPFYPQNISRINSKEQQRSNYISSITLENGTLLPVEMVFNLQGSIPNYELAKQIGVDQNEKKCIIVDAEQRTNIPFVYAAGDITAVHSHQIVSAAHEGSMAAQAANYDLYESYQKL